MEDPALSGQLPDQSSVEASLREHSIEATVERKDYDTSVEGGVGDDRSDKTEDFGFGFYEIDLGTKVSPVDGSDYAIETGFVVWLRQHESTDAAKAYWGDNQPRKARNLDRAGTVDPLVTVIDLESPTSVDEQSAVCWSEYRIGLCNYLYVWVAFCEWTAEIKVSASTVFQDASQPPTDLIDGIVDSIAKSVKCSSRRDN